MDVERPSALERLLAERLAGIELAAPVTTEADYDAILARIIRRVRSMRETVTRNQARVEDRYTDFVDQPRGRQQTVLANSPPSMLLALAYALMRASYEHRFDDVQRSLALAKLGHRTAKAVARTACLSPGSASDLIGESLGYLANAMRLNSDLLGAERALADAETHLEAGSRDRSLRACHLSFLASLRHAQGRAKEAGELWEREAAIWRLLKDPGKLGTALISSGLAVCWIGDLPRAAKLIRKGAELVDSDRMAFLGLLHLAEAFARAGDGLQAWKLLSTGDLIGMVIDPGDELTRQQRWVKGLTYRALGEVSYAESLLTGVRDEYVENGQPLRAAFASLDLIGALAAQKKHGDVLPLADVTYRLLKAERLEEKALSAFLILRRAALAKELTEELAVKVANFIARRQHNREARYE